jgi:hypothetical protein
VDFGHAGSALPGPRYRDPKPQLQAGALADGPLAKSGINLVRGRRPVSANVEQNSAPGNAPLGQATAALSAVPAMF